MNSPSTEPSSGHRSAPDFVYANVGAVPFRTADPNSIVRWISTLATGRTYGVNIRFANAWNVALANDDANYMAIMTEEGAINLPDGTPVVWFMKMSRQTAGRTHRLRGPSIFRAVLEDSARVPLRHFLLGGSPATLTSLRDRLRVEYPSAAVAGSYSPPFAPVTDEFIQDCVDRVREVDPDVVWVGLGTPKQDYVGTAISREINVPVLNVGAAFDFVGQTSREAPRFIQRSGFEWLYRLASEPRRLGYRYLYGNARFLQVAVSSAARRKRRDSS